MCFSFTFSHSVSLSSHRIICHSRTLVSLSSSLVLSVYGFFFHGILIRIRWHSYFWSVGYHVSVEKRWIFSCNEVSRAVYTRILIPCTVRSCLNLFPVRVSFISNEPECLILRWDSVYNVYGYCGTISVLRYKYEKFSKVIELLPIYPWMCHHELRYFPLFISNFVNDNHLYAHVF